MPFSRCPCGSGLDYANCCKRFHDGLPAPTALELMRSRYSAYALGLVAYIQRTWEKQVDASQIAAFCKESTFCGLTIVAFGEDWVEFIAEIKQQGRRVRLHEKSRFKRSADGQWYYVDGETTLLDT